MGLTTGRAWWQRLLLCNPSRQPSMFPFLFIFVIVVVIASLVKSPEAWEMECMLASVSPQIWSHLIHVCSSTHSAWQNPFFDASYIFSAPATVVFVACFLCMVNNAVQCAPVLRLGSWHSAQPLQVSVVWCVFVDSRVTLMCHNQAGLYEEADAAPVRCMHQDCGLSPLSDSLVFCGLKLES